MKKNGIVIEKELEKYEKHLREWHEKGLDVISVSIAHYNREKNGRIFTPEYMDLEKLIRNLHQIGFSVRLSCTLIRGYIDSVEEVLRMINSAKRWKVEQLTFRQLARPDVPENSKVFEWTERHKLDDAELERIRTFFENEAEKLMTFSHGATIYD